MPVCAFDPFARPSQHVWFRQLVVLTYCNYAKSLILLDTILPNFVMQMEINVKQNRQVSPMPESHTNLILPCRQLRGRRLQITAISSSVLGRLPIRKQLVWFSIATWALQRNKTSHHWAGPCEHVSSSLCGQLRPRSDRASLQSDQGIHCPQTESFASTECTYIVFELRAEAGDTLCACAGWSESAHFAHARRHWFAWRSPLLIIWRRKYYFLFIINPPLYCIFIIEAFKCEISFCTLQLMRHWAMQP